MCVLRGNNVLIKCRLGICQQKVKTKEDISEFIHRVGTLIMWQYRKLTWYVTLLYLSRWVVWKLCTSVTKTIPLNPERTFSTTIWNCVSITRTPTQVLPILCSSQHFFCDQSGDWCHDCGILKKQPKKSSFKNQAQTTNSGSGQSLQVWIETPYRFG